jgi:hypothetical protein
MRLRCICQSSLYSQDSGLCQSARSIPQRVSNFDAMRPNLLLSGRAVNKVPLAFRCRAAQLWRSATYVRCSITILIASLFLASVLDGRAAAGVRSTKASSCSLLKKKVARLDSLPETGPPGAGWFCDFSSLSGNRWFVVALRSNRTCSGDCSNLIGWYAINRRNGEIHSYDIAQLRVGLPL